MSTLKLTNLDVNVGTLILQQVMDLFIANILLHIFPVDAMKSVALEKVEEMKRRRQGD